MSTMVGESRCKIPNEKLATGKKIKSLETPYKLCKFYPIYLQTFSLNYIYYLSFQQVIISNLRSFFGSEAHTFHH